MGVFSRPDPTNLRSFHVVSPGFANVWWLDKHDKKIFPLNGGEFTKQNRISLFDLSFPGSLAKETKIS